MENNPALQQIWEHTIPVLQGAPAARADAEIQQSARGCVCASHTALCLCDDGGKCQCASAGAPWYKGTSWRDPPGATTPAAQGGEESDADPRGAPKAQPCPLSPPSQGKNAACSDVVAEMPSPDPTSAAS